MLACEVWDVAVNQLDDEELSIGYFQQVGATSHTSRQHGQNSVLFRRPRHFKGTLATALARSDAASLFLMGISERDSLPNKPRTIDALKVNITEEIQAVRADVLARTFQNMARRVQSVWTQMLATSSTCYDITFLTQ